MTDKEWENRLFDAMKRQCETPFYRAVMEREQAEKAEKEQQEKEQK